MIEVHWVNHFQHIDNIQGQYKSLEEAQQSVMDWWKTHRFRPFKIREWKKDDGTIVWGYGAQNCFYHFKEIK